MSNHRYPPAYLRYLRARLFNLGKPQFWGTAIVLCVIGLVIQQYSSSEPGGNRNQNSGVISAETNGSSLSEEEKAIAADIDNLPSLLAGTEPIIVPTTNSQESQDKDKTLDINATSKPLPVDSPKSNSTSLDSGVVNTETSTSPASVNKSIFISQAEDLLRFGATNNDQLLGYKPLNESTTTTEGTTTSSFPRPGLVNQINQTQNINSTNQLPTALNQSNNPTFPGLNNNSLTVINSTGRTTDVLGKQPLPSNQTFSTSTGLNVGTGYIQPNSYNNLNNNQPVAPNTGINSGTQPNSYNNLNNNQPVAPNTGINLGTGYIQPTTPNLQPSSYNNFNNNQTVPNQTPSTPTYVTGTSPIIGPYTVRNPRVNPLTITTPKVPSNYGNSILQQPSQIPQSNFSNNSQPQSQPINGLPNR